MLDMQEICSGTSKLGGWAGAQPSACGDAAPAAEQQKCHRVLLRKQKLSFFP